MRRLKNGWLLVKKSVGAWLDDYAPSMGAAISYYTLFSIAPLLIIIIAIIGAVLGEEAAEGKIVRELASVLGPDAAQTIQTIVRNARNQGHGLLAAIGGFLTLLIGATSVVGELQSALNRIWRTPEARKPSGVWNVIRQRLLSFSLILGLVFLLLISLAISAVLNALSGWWSSGIHQWTWLLEVINAVVSFAVVTGLFGLIYKLLPRERLAWRDVLIGAVVTAGLFTIGKTLIGLYLGRSSTASAYGAAGSLIILLLWVYYSAQIFLLGAEFTWVYTYAHGSRKGQAPPEPESVHVPTQQHRPLTPRPA